MNSKRDAIRKAALVGLMLLSTAAWSYVMRVDRFEVNRSIGAPFVDEFDDGQSGGWTNFNGFQTFGTWTEESGTGFARLESPGLFFSGLPGVLLGPSDRSDIFSNAIASSQVTSGGHFHGVLTLDSALPSANQTFYFSLNYLRPGAVVLSDNVLVGLSNLSAGRAVALGLTGGLYLFEGHIIYGPPPTIATVTETAFVLLSAPASIGPVQLDIDYEEVTGSGTFTVGYRLSPSGPFASPLAPIASTLVAGFWDIGTAQAVPEPAVANLFLLGLACTFVYRVSRDPGGDRNSGSKPGWPWVEPVQHGAGSRKDRGGRLTSSAARPAALPC